MKSKLLTAHKGYIVIVTLLFACGQMWAQSSIDNLRNVIPPSPNSAAFAKYGDWPVSLYTGVPSVSVPVTTLKGRTISVPVSLSYHASGNRVADIASWVGLGWSLNAGGVISRSVRGLNDEGNFFESSAYYSNPNDLSTCTSDQINQLRVVATAKGLMDSEQDIYNFSAMGKSYRLLIMADGSVYTVPHSNVKFLSNPIAGSGASGGSWTVLMEDGTKLLFGGGPNFIETTNNPSLKSADGSGIDFPSSWQLQTITSTTGETINFQYTPSTIEQDSYFSQSDNIKYKASSTEIDPNGGSSCLMIEHSLTSNSKASIQQVVTLNLSSIESDLERLDFIAIPGRLDVFGGTTLTGVKLFSKLTNQYTEDYTFNTSYSQAVGSNQLLLGTTNTSHFQKRLRLNSFEKKDVLNPTAPSQKWTFDYNPQNLPSRRSYAQDHWGYFNGATANTTLLPKAYFQLPNFPNLSYLLPTTGFMPGHHELGASKNPNSNFMQAEILTAVHYPTGGYSQFSYEPNSTPVTKETFTDTQTDISLYLTYGQTPFTNNQTVSFTLTKPGYVGLYLGDIQINNIDQPDAAVSATVLDQNGNLVVGTTASNTTTWFNILQAGTYTFKVGANNVGAGAFTNASSNISANAYIQYSKSNGVQSFNELTGGLRVTSTMDFDGTTGSLNVKYYQYANAYVINPINEVKDYVTTQTSSMKKSGNEVCHFINTIRSTSSKNAAGTIQGGTTGYGTVTTLYGAGGVNGSTISTFSNSPDEIIVSGDTHEFPYPFPDSRDHRRGLLLTQKDFNAQQVLLKQVDNTYSFNTIGTIISFKAGYSDLMDPAFCTNPYANCGITQTYYGITTEQLKHVTTKQTVYDEAGENPSQSKTTYYYDTPANTQAVRTVTYDSKGDSITMYSKTALDMPISSIITAMINNNMVGQVLQKEEYDNSTFVSRQTTNYSNSWGTNNFILPQSVQVQNGTGAAYTSLTVNNYDAKGNVLQLAPLSGVIKNYIWDYNSSKPIAEVTNASLQRIAFTSFESDGSGNWTVSNAARDNSNAFTGGQSYSITGGSLSIAGLSSATYVVSLWAKTGAVINVNSSAVTGGDSRNGWTYYQTTVTGTSVTITGTGTVDEVRLFPAGALMTTYTYGPYGMTSSTDANNITSYYKYDGMGRLITLRNDKNEILKTYQYNYKQ